MPTVRSTTPAPREISIPFMSIRNSARWWGWAVRFFRGSALLSSSCELLLAEQETQARLRNTSAALRASSSYPRRHHHQRRGHRGAGRQGVDKLDRAKSKRHRCGEKRDGGD